MSALLMWAKKQRAFLLYLGLGVLFRFWNFRHFLFFTWDQGRDAMVLQQIASGDPVLVGPTSGLQGFFLGPLWYYLGLPGYLLSEGNPYGISLWYIFLASLALPLFWIMGHQLFRSKKFAILCAYLLAFLPGSISGSTMIWNPLLTLPLMSAAFLAFQRARTNRLWLWLGFFLLALNLQAEFAYAVFFITPLFLLIPWLRKQWHPLDFFGSAAAVGITLIPQLAFELRNDWIMTRSLLRAMADPTLSATWERILSHRPGELFWTTVNLFVGGWGKQAFLLTPAIIGAILFGFHAVFKIRQQKNQHSFGWQLLALFAFLPYPFFMVWRGNYGNFFDYYLTPHFIFLAPLLLLGLSEFSRYYLPKNIRSLYPARDWAVLIVGILFTASVVQVSGRLLEKNNRAGLLRMLQAVDRINGWSLADGQGQPLVRVFTPNLQTEQYDYLFRWKAKQNNRPVPLTVKTGNEDIWYIMTEPDYQIPEQRFVPWYREATRSGHLWRREQIGVLTLETWGRDPYSTESAVAR